MPPAPICAATGKRIYKRHQDAAKVVGRAAKHNPIGLAQGPQSIYRCESCGRWHTTSMSQLHYEIMQIMREAA